MAMYSRVPVIPLIKDYNVLTIKTKTFRVALTAGGRSELFDQDVIDEDSVEALLIGVRKFRDMAYSCAFSPADTFSFLHWILHLKYHPSLLPLHPVIPAVYCQPGNKYLSITPLPWYLVPGI
jgi:hypothetical protein